MPPKKIKGKKKKGETSPPLFQVFFPSLKLINEGPKDTWQVYLEQSWRDDLLLDLKYYCPVYQLELPKLYEMLGLEQGMVDREILLAHIFQLFNSEERMKNPLLFNPLIAQKTKEFGCDHHNKISEGDVVKIGDFLYHVTSLGFRNREDNHLV